MSTTTFKPGDLVQITKEIFNREGLVKGDIVEVAENISSSPQKFTSIIMPSGKAQSWFNDCFEKIDSWTNTSRGLDGRKYYVKDGRVWAAQGGKTWWTRFSVSDLAELEGFVKNPAVEVSEHGFTVGQRLYTTNSQWPEIDFVGEFTFNGKPYVKGTHSVWGMAGHFHLSEVSATAPLADWEKELLEGPKEEQESEPPFAREGVVYTPKATDDFEVIYRGINYRIVDGVLMADRDPSQVFGVRDITPDRFEIVAEPDAEVEEELPPVSRKHFDESKAAGERRRQKLITHVEELQAKLSEKNKVIAQQQAQLQHVRELVNTVKLALY